MWRRCINSQFVVAKTLSATSTSTRFIINTQRPNISSARLLSHYAVLGLEPSASIQDVKAAYLRKAKQLHPDVVKTARKELDGEAFNQVMTAYEVLGDTEARFAYDKELEDMLGKNKSGTLKLKRESPLERKLRTLIESGDVDTAVELWKADESSLKVLLHIIEVCHNSRKIPSNVPKLLDHLHRADPAIDHGADSADGSEAQSLVVFTERKTKAYNNLIRMCHACGTKENVFEVLDAIEANKIQVDMETYMALEEVFYGTTS